MQQNIAVLHQSVAPTGCRLAAWTCYIGVVGTFCQIGGRILCWRWGTPPRLYVGAHDEMVSVGLIAPTLSSPSGVGCDRLKTGRVNFKGATWLEKSRTRQLKNILANLRLPRGAPVTDLSLKHILKGYST